MVIVASKPCVQGRQQNNTDDQVGKQTTDNDNRKRPLRIGPDAVRERRRQQAQRGNQHGHRNRPKPQHRAFHRGIFNVIASSPKLVNVLHHDDADLHRNAKQRKKSDAGRNAEVRAA